MFTRCPACLATLPLEAASLARSGGTVRCGGCGKTFHALDRLFDHRPEPGSEPLPASEIPPMVEPLMPRSGDLPLGAPEPPPQPGPVLVLDPQATPPPRWVRRAWPLIAVILAGALGYQLLHESRGAGIAALFGAGAGTEWLDPNEHIHIVSRDMHPHPAVEDAVLISTTLVNASGHSLPFPVLEIRLLDTSQQVIGMRRLEPEDYVPGIEARSAGFPPDVLLPVVVELVVGNTRPSGFQFRFH